MRSLRTFFSLLILTAILISNLWGSAEDRSKVHGHYDVWLEKHNTKGVIQASLHQLNRQRSEQQAKLHTYTQMEEAIRDITQDWDDMVETINRVNALLQQDGQQIPMELRAWLHAARLVRANIEGAAGQRLDHLFNILEGIGNDNQDLINVLMEGIHGIILQGNPAHLIGLFATLNRDHRCSIDGLDNDISQTTSGLNSTNSEIKKLRDSILEMIYAYRGKVGDVQRGASFWEHEMCLKHDICGFSRNYNTIVAEHSNRCLDVYGNEKGDGVYSGPLKLDH